MVTHVSYSQIYVVHTTDYALDDKMLNILVISKSKQSIRESYQIKQKHLSIEYIPAESRIQFFRLMVGMIFAKK